MKYLLTWFKDRQKLVDELRQKDALILAQRQLLGYCQEFRSLCNHCETCCHWAPFYVAFHNAAHASGDKKAGGLCMSGKMTEDVTGEYTPDMLVYPYAKGGYFWVGPKFGCVHYEKK